MPTTWDKYATLTERTDRVLNTKENTVISTLNKSLQAAFDSLELDLRRVYPADTSALSILNSQATAAALLSQVRAAMQVVDPAQALEYEKVLSGLLSETQTLAVETGHKSLDIFEKGVVTFAPRIPIEVAATAAEQAINRLEKHGKDFASAAAVTITQGILQRWSIDETVRALRSSQDIAKSNAEMIVRTETLSAYNVAAVAMYERNGIEYVIRYATADDRTCVVCGGRAGEITAIGKEQAVLHPRCRCYFAPFKKEWAKAGVFDLGTLDTFAEQVRAAHPTPEKLTGKTLSSFEKSAGLTGRSAVYRRPNMKGVAPAAPPKEPATPATPINQYVPLAQSGARVLGSKLRRLDESIGAARPEVDPKLGEALAEAYKRDPANGRTSPEFKAYMAAVNAPAPAEAMMIEIRKGMQKLPDATLKAMAANTPIDKSTSPVADERTIRSNLADFYALSGGRGSDSLKNIKFVDDRAYASEDGTLNIGRQQDAAETRRVFFHEMGHHIEFEQTHIRVQLADWVKSRAGGADPVPLNDIDPGKYYDADEMARPDKFIDPYVGKVYADGSTEVLSMGIEHFASPKGMVELYTRDREHFLLIIGALSD